MRVAICDGCGESYGMDKPMIAVLIPGEIIEADGELNLDFCSWDCVVNLNFDETPEPVQEPVQEEPFVKIDQGIYRPIPPEELAEVTERATGVRMKR